MVGGKRTESNLLPKGTAFTARRRHQPVLTCTSRSFRSFGCRDRSRTDLEQLMRLPGSRTSLLRGARLFISIACSRYIRGLQNLQSKWRKREVAIPNGESHPSRFERAPDARPVTFPKNWRKAERTMLIRRKAYQSHSKRRRRPGRLAFREWRSGEVSIPARCRAAGFQNPPPSRRRPLRIEIGVPSEIRTPYLPHRRRMLCSSELRELILVRARGIEPAPSTVICRSGLIRPSRTPVLARKSVRRVIGQGGVIRTRDLMRPRHALLPG